MIPETEPMPIAGWTLEREALHRIYMDAGLTANDGHDCHHYTTCSASCGTECKLLPPTGAYIGEDYGKQTRRILFVGINTNRASESSDQFYAPYHYISGDDAYLAGCLHRVMRTILGNPTIEKGEHAKTSRCFAFTNAIKCSTTAIAGKPTDSMRDNCAKYLRAEIEVLQPNVILALGLPPFESIYQAYEKKAVLAPEPYSNWIYYLPSFTNSATPKTIPVIRLMHYAAYRHVRKAYRSLKNGDYPRGFISPFVSPDCNPKEFAESLEREFPRECRIDPSNPLYDFIFKHLWNEAQTYVSPELRTGDSR